MRNKTHLGPSPNATGLPVSGASTLTKPETGPARDENSYSNAQGNNTGIIREGLGSLNRWSQSTASSRSPPNNPVGHRRGSSVSGYGGYGDSNSPEGVFASPIAINMLDQPSQTTITPIRPAQVQGNHTPQGSQTSGPTEPLTLGLQESSAIEAGQHDFANVSDGNAIPLHEDDTDETPPAVGENLSSSVIRENSGGKRYRSHSQKAMLSKALQKANTAVLLDNAANFEGAMDAYNEACQLLQLVMLRSNGGNGEKIKLQEIVGTFICACLTGCSKTDNEPM